MKSRRSSLYGDGQGNNDDDDDNDNDDDDDDADHDRDDASDEDNSDGEDGILVGNRIIASPKALSCEKKCDLDL